MTSLLLRSAALTAASLVLWGSPAQAGPVPEGPVWMHLKNYPDLPLAWVEGEGARLQAAGSAWVLEPVQEEALVGVGEFRIVHDESGECLDAGELYDGVHAKLDLVDCADADPWTVTYDTAVSNSDFRFATPEGYLLGLEHDEAPAEDDTTEDGAIAEAPPEDDATAEVTLEEATPEAGAIEEHSAIPTEGAEVFAVDMPFSKHSHEWLFATAPVVPPETPSPTPSTESPAAPAAPQLPQTGAALGAAVGAGAFALAGGTALVLWWQRRRALRANW